MVRRSFRAKARTIGLAVSVALSSAHAAAQEPAPEPAPAEPPPKTDELVEQLLESPESGGPGDDDDIEWLFSESEEYSPSGLVGEPVPAPALPERGEGSPRTWDPRWRRFELGNYILTGTALAIAIGSALIPEAPDRWRGKNEIDESVRDGIGITNYSAGQWGRDGSDVALSVSVTFPLMVDSLIGLFWYRRSPDVAKQTALIATEAIGVTAALQGLTSGFSSRERPYGRNCGASIDGEIDHCVERRRYRSFFSGHTAMSFAAAGATCTNHYYHQVWGDGFADGLTCGLAFLTAGAAGTLRIVGDQHYASDVAIGAAVGTLSGLGIPWLLHYGPVARNEGSVKLKLAPVGHGVGMLGEF